MSEADIPDQVLQLIKVAHERLAAFARESYETVGRGAILIAMPLASGTSARIPTELVYRPATDFERLFDELDDEDRVFLGEAGLADAYVVIRMMKTYDPSTQAVLVITIEGYNPIIMKVKLEPPLVIDERPGIQ